MLRHSSALTKLQSKHFGTSWGHLPSWDVGHIDSQFSCVGGIVDKLIQYALSVKHIKGYPLVFIVQKEFPNLYGSHSQNKFYTHSFISNKACKDANSDSDSHLKHLTEHGPLKESHTITVFSATGQRFLCVRRWRFRLFFIK